MEFKDKLTQKLNEIAGTDMPTINSKLVEMAKSFGGKVYLVGGAVRDELMGIKPKDYDFLITKISLPDLAKKLSQTIPGSKVNEVGQSFGIIKLTLGTDEFDFAIPRKDVDRENVKTDPNIPVEEDLIRRDFTINSMAKDLETNEIVNAPGQNGQEDIKNKVLRATGDPVKRFQEDPLRMLRCLQFCARFNFTIEPKTLLAIKENVDLLNNVSGERFYEEFYKAWTKGAANTKIFFELMNSTGLGRLLFGPNFLPIPISTKFMQNPHDGFIAQAICAFLNGGEFRKVIIKTDEQDIINVALWFKNAVQNGVNFNTLKMVSNHGRYYNLILNTFKHLGEENPKYKELYEGMMKLLSVPLIPLKSSSSHEPYELPLSGGDIIALAGESGTPIQGKLVSDVILKLIKAYQDKTISVGQTDEENKEIVKSFLISLLKESYTGDFTRIEVVKKRIGNIFNEGN